MQCSPDNALGGFIFVPVRLGDTDLLPETELGRAEEDLEVGNKKYHVPIMSTLNP